MTVSSISELKQWLAANKISEVECIFPDIAGSSKGKILPVQRFIKSMEDQSLKLADSVFGQTVFVDCFWKNDFGRNRFWKACKVMMT